MKGCAARLRTGSAGGTPDLALIMVAAAAGAFVGDQVAYAIGQRIDVRRLPLLRQGRGRRTLLWAEQSLIRRGPSFILAARFIPVARVAVNVAAGALGYPRRRFMGLAAIGSVAWAGYSAIVGIGAGAWFMGHPVGAVVLGVGGGLLIGVLLDLAFTRLQRRPVRDDTPAAQDRDATGDAVARETA